MLKLNLKIAKQKLYFNGNNGSCHLLNLICFTFIIEKYLQQGASLLSRPADEFGNDGVVEEMWAVKAIDHAEVYFNVSFTSWKYTLFGSYTILKKNFSYLQASIHPALD